MPIDDAPRTHVIKFYLNELSQNGTSVDSEVRDAARVLERYYNGSAFAYVAHAV